MKFWPHFILKDVDTRINTTDQSLISKLINSFLENNSELKVVGFLDDNKQFHNQTILGQIVFDPLKINELINRRALAAGRGSGAARASLTVEL